MIRLWYKDGTYMDVDNAYEAACYANDPECDRTEELNKVASKNSNKDEVEEDLCTDRDGPYE